MADDPTGVNHDTHDLAAIVAYVDGAADPVETATATSLLATCPACVRLADDLRALATADRSMAVPARPRDFRLTPADAARLGAVGEPSVLPARLVIDMTDRHPTHEPALIAASIDDVLTADERRTVDDWLATCTACTELQADLLAIAAANRALPTPARPRDYRLTEQDVARVGQARWKQLLAWVGGSRDGITRPLATGLMTLGFVGILISGMPSLSFGASAGAAPQAAPSAASQPAAEIPSDATYGQIDKSGDTAIPDASAAAGAASQATELAPLASGPDQVTIAASPSANAPAASGDASLEMRVTNQGAETPLGRDAATSSLPTGLVVSLIALLAGLLLFVLRRTSRSFRSV